MSARHEWSVEEPWTLTLEESVDAVRIRVIDGAVNVVGARPTLRHGWRSPNCPDHHCW